MLQEQIILETQIMEIIKIYILKVIVLIVALTIDI